MSKVTNKHNMISPLLKFWRMAMLGALLFTVKTGIAQQVRQDILLNNNWRTVYNADAKANQGFEQQAFADKRWLSVNVPHNWDGYEGYRRLKHGNKHGYAWYRKTFALSQKQAGKRYFLWFEGVGSYATVWLNGKQVGYHAGGRTSFTLDITDAVKAGKQNILAVRADHPAGIKDLPWVCGGCSDETGFSEGSQPMGIFRPVHLIITDAVRIQPFGVHIWNDTTVSERSATLNLQTEVKNYNPLSAQIKITNKLLDATGKTIVQTATAKQLKPNEIVVIDQRFGNIRDVNLWSLENPYLYTVVTEIWKNSKLTDRISTLYGIRWISWPIGRNNGDNRFYLNGKPVFINGTAEYEHLMGKSHAFTDQEIDARVKQVKAAGFNAFRDAHQPHNLRYQQHWDTEGILWWPQMAAHIWYDTPQFRETFKALLVDWIKERRNSPSVILWGLENESKLPEDFARECTELIRKLDPTAALQRKVTTCNGGKGTDWDVPQNWTGTYGGDPLQYGNDLKRQILIGEYGAWRSLDMHTEGKFVQNGALSEDRMTQLMETKIRLAGQVKDSVAGQFHWLLYSHENPGRIQGGEGLRELDRVGPVNYKGLFTAWGQPTDAFYMYRANYVPKDKGPMVYIVSHTWPNRWLTPGVKDSITVYSNCDEVELFNGADGPSLGKKKNDGTGTHFQWDKVSIKYNTLYAAGYVNGKKVAEDEVVFNHLPKAPGKPILTDKISLKPTEGYKYLYRLNCGGPGFTDRYGSAWTADIHQQTKNGYGSRSWTDDYAGLPAFFASQQRTFDNIVDTYDEKLFQTYRYGMDKLNFNFPLPNGDYRVELYFTEPWYGIGGGMDCTGWRLFDVLMNGETKLKQLDIWKEAGVNKALKKTVTAHVNNGLLTISFGNINAGEAIISGIAISTLNKQVKLPPVKPEGIISLKNDSAWELQSWMDIGQQQYIGTNTAFYKLPPIFFGTDWIKTMPGKTMSFTLNEDADIYVAMDAEPTQRPQWLADYEITGLFIENDANEGTKMPVYRKRFKKGATVTPGENRGKLMYTIILLPVTMLQPATDLRPTITYKADNVQLQGEGIATDTAVNKKVARFVNSKQGSAVFALTPGVADLYALRIKYYNQTDKTFKANIKLLAADNTVMKEEE
jgi:beta-galactosidase